MQSNTLFVSYKFNDLRALEYVQAVREVALKLQRTMVVDGKSLIPEADFAGNISSFIRDSATCLVAVFTTGAHANVNAIYEVGIAYGAGKPIILIADALEVVPTMLGSYDVIVRDPASLHWPDEFRRQLEIKMRHFLQQPDDHLIEEKLKRRYTAEELAYFSDVKAVEDLLDFIRLGDLRKTQGILELKLSNEPNNVDLLFLLGDVLYLQGCACDSNNVFREDYFTRQLDVADRALLIEPANPLLLVVRITALMRLGKIDQALISLNRQLELDERFSLAHYNMACVCAFLRDKEGMLRHLGRASELNATWKEYAKGDPDLKYYRDDADWYALIYK
jgi:tetratricopeptide (TPR) repeat protein